MEFTHFDEKGRARMVDVGDKDVTHREAVAVGSIKLKKQTLEMVREGSLKKGDVLAAAQIGGIMGAKSTSSLIPMCHNIVLDGIDIDFNIDEERSRIEITASVRTTGKTGAEMEALTAVSICALTVYDMCKAVDKEMAIENIRLIRKIGGKSDINLE